MRSSITDEGMLKSQQKSRQMEMGGEGVEAVGEQPQCNSSNTLSKLMLGVVLQQWILLLLMLGERKKNVEHLL